MYDQIVDAYNYPKAFVRMRPKRVGFFVQRAIIITTCIPSDAVSDCVRPYYFF